MTQGILELRTVSEGTMYVSTIQKMKWPYSAKVINELLMTTAIVASLLGAKCSYLIGSILSKLGQLPTFHDDEVI